MKVKFEGLNCPNCAKKLESQLNKVDGIDFAVVDFFKGMIEFESKNIKKAYKDVIKTAKLIEPNIQISTLDGDKKRSNTKFIIDCALLVLGIVLGLIVIFAPLYKWAYWTMLFASAVFMGYMTYYKACRLLLKGIINENLLVTISVFGAIAIGEHFEGLMVIALYQIGKVLEGLAVSKSKKSIEALTKFKPEFAILLKDGKEVKVLPKQLNIGDIIIVRPGEMVSVDGIVIDGTASLDVQSLTGESLPVSVKENDEILSGSIVYDGMLKIKSTKKYEESTVNTIINLIETASEKKSKTETFISKITKWYTLGVIVLSILTFGIVMLVTKNLNTAIYRGLIFLVVSCPCAFAISVPLSYFSGLGNASKNGILIKGSNYLDACAKLNIIAFDKTGTITTGGFEIEKIENFKEENREDRVLFLASLGEQYSLHPLAKSIIKHNYMGLEEAQNVKEVAGEGVYYTYKDNNYFVGRKSENLQGTVVELFENDVKIGQITLKDKVKESAKITCQKLSDLNIETVMLSGDNKNVAQEVADEVGITKAYGELLPQDKYEWIKQKTNNPYYTVGYVGDGLNDAPSLMLSSVGFCMGINGNHASIEASDIVIANDNIEKIPLAIDISKYTRKIVWQNIILSAIIKVTFLTLGAFGVTGMLAAVIADVGVTLMAILNSLRALNYKKKK